MPITDTACTPILNLTAKFTHTVSWPSARAASSLLHVYALTTPPFSAFLEHALLQMPQGVPLFATPWTEACQAPLSMGFSRQEYWSGLPWPPPGNLPGPGMEAKSPAPAGGFFTTSATSEAH